MALIDQIMSAYHRKFEMSEEQATILKRELQALLLLSHDERYQLLVGATLPVLSKEDT